MARAQAGDPEYSRRAVASWVLYDTANTLFSYAVVTRYFNDWLLVQRREPDWTVGLMTLSVSIVLIFSLPFFGALADATGRRKPLLGAFTGLCVLMTVVLGAVEEMPWPLVVAGVAVYAYNSALAHYDPLLASVAPPERQGRVSGLGVASGYAGVIVAIFALSALVGSDRQAAFVPTAVTFGLLAIPALIFVRESGRPPRGSTGGIRVLAGEALHRTTASVRAARRAPYGRFLIARFLYVDAVATVIAFITVYAKRTAGFDDAGVDLLLTSSIVGAIAGALLAGPAAERIGPRRVLLITVLGVSIVLAATGASGAPTLLWVAAPLVGASLGALTTADRVLLMRLAPPERRGEAFGLYALVGRLSSGVGPFLLWGGTIWLTSEALRVLSLADAGRAALVVLALAGVGGALVLRGVPDRA
jgi:UMF1 family MFS transporter